MDIGQALSSPHISFQLIKKKVESTQIQDVVVSRSVISDAFNSFGSSSDHRRADILILKAVAMIEWALSLLETMFCYAFLGYSTKNVPFD